MFSALKRIIINCSLTFQAVVDVAVKELLALKAEFKSVSGKDWSPNAVPTTTAPAAAAAPTSSASNVDHLNSQVKAAGDKVRDLKAKKAEKVNFKICSSNYSFIYQFIELFC